MRNVKSITPLPPADFTPEVSNYKSLRPFRYWCQKILPLVYDDSLSYYELLCKVVDYLNKTMEDVETLHSDVTNLHTAYEKLQSYVNNYFSTLDVQEEINNKLDNMASNGELYEIIRRYTDPIVNEQNEQINVLKVRMDTFASLPDGSTSGDAELTDIRVGYNGHVYPNAGDAVREQVSGLKGDLVKLENGDGLPNTVRVRGSFRADGVISYGTQNRVASETNMVFKKDTKISVSDGFRFLVLYLEGETVINNIIVLDTITISANQEFKINIYRNVEEESEIADIDLFVSKLICPNKIQKQFDEVNNKADKINSLTMLNKKNLHQMFKKVTVIGDSLSSGFIYDEDNNPHSLYEHSWGAIMGGRYNAQYNLACFGGATTKSWWNNEIADRGLDFACSHRAEAYIIALGVNDSGYFEGNIGNRASINLNDYNQNGDTFYGWYAKIIQKMHDLNGGVVFCLTLPRCIHPSGNEIYNTMNIAIRDIVYYLQTNTSINVNLVDLDAHYIEYYTSKPIENMYYMSHYQVGAYALMANIISDAIDNIIYDNPTRFRYAELVETD